MFDIRVKSVTEGTCWFCQKPKKAVFDVVFPDKFIEGLLCEGCFVKATKLKAAMANGGAQSSGKPVAKEHQ